MRGASGGRGRGSCPYALGRPPAALTGPQVPRTPCCHLPFAPCPCSPTLPTHCKNPGAAHALFIIEDSKDLGLTSRTGYPRLQWSNLGKQIGTAKREIRGAVCAEGGRCGEGVSTPHRWEGAWGGADRGQFDWIGLCSVFCVPTNTV